MKPKVIDVPFKNLKKIYHLADIHVRLMKRHAEYRDVFQTLYEELLQADTENSIIVVAGDIVHAKTDMSPEMIAMASDFLRSLSEIAPTFVFAGNHDLNLANTNRLDALTPIIDNLGLSNLHYLKYSGIYKIADVEFGVFSVLGDKRRWPSADKLSSKTKIALFHGPVNNAKTDVGYVITNRHITLSLFAGYDVVLLGDIHRHQILQEYSPKLGQPIVVYPGSLIQQSHGETIDGHGYMIWDVSKKTFEFKELRNAYGYVTLNLIHGKIQESLTNVPDNPRIRLFVGDTDHATVKKASALLRKKFSVQEITINRIVNSGDTAQSKTGILNEFADVREPTHQNDLIKVYLEERFPQVGKETLEKINDINVRLNQKIPDDDLSRNVHWRPIHFKFSNMFSYGENNEINFDDMEGVYGLFSPNATGKTAALDAFMFTLFDKTPRAFKASHIMNNQKNDFECELKFEINAETYGIRRVGTRNKKGDVRVDVDFWKEVNGKVESLNGEDRRDTNAAIRSHIGDYEDFLLTNISVQNNGALFIDKSQSERKDLLSQFMGINIFDKLCGLALDEMKEVVGALKRFNRDDFTENLAVTQTNIEIEKGIYDSTEDQIKSKAKLRDKIDIKVRELFGEKIPLDVTETNLEKLEEKFGKLQLNVKTIDSDLLLTEEKIFNTKTKLAINRGRLKEFQDMELESKISKYELKVSAQRKLIHKTSLLGVEIKNKEQKLDHLREYEYDPNCKFCINNVFVKDAKSTESQLEKDLVVRKKLIEEHNELNTEIFDLKPYNDLYDEFAEVQRNIDKLDTDLSRTKSNLDKLNANKTVQVSKIKETEFQIKRYHESVDSIEKNKEVDKKIAEEEKGKQVLTSEIKALETQLRKVHGEIEVLKATKSEMIKAIKDAEDLEDTYEAYEYYTTAIGRDGIPSELIKKVIPTIEAEINNILSQIVEFTVTLEIDGKNINGRIVYDFDRHWALELSSGMERFVTSLAIRVALLNISNLPKPNFLVVDEGLGTLDADNLASMSMMFSILKSQFDFIIVISHLDTIRDAVDNLIEIKTVGGFSSINV
jgi:DNA repair exonuclease SbcCD ATPase subunit/predicted phosphodiesterase